jgi:flagellar basal body-associated protein FliL
MLGLKYNHALMERAVALMQTDDRKTRLIAFAVITLVFVVSMSGVVYWAINVSSAEIPPQAASNPKIQAPIAPTESATLTLNFAVTSSRLS